MSDLTINTALQNVNSMPSRRPAASDNGDASKPAPMKVPSPSEFHSSPKGTIDSSSGMFVIQFRDGDGNVKMQYPSSKVAHEYARNSSDAPQGTDVNPTDNPSEGPESA